MRDTAAAEGAMPLEFGPPLVAKPSCELLGDELLKPRRPREAAEAYAAALARFPGRTLSLEGRLASLRAIGDATEADRVKAEQARYRRE